MYYDDDDAHRRRRRGQSYPLYANTTACVLPPTSVIEASTVDEELLGEITVLISPSLFPLDRHAPKDDGQAPRLFER